MSQQMTHITLTFKSKDHPNVPFSDGGGVEVELYSFFTSALDGT